MLGRPQPFAMTGFSTWGLPRDPRSTMGMRGLARLVAVWAECVCADSHSQNHSGSRTHQDPD